MELLLFGLALTATHIIGLIVLFILFCVSTAYDRRGQSVFKWLVLLGTLVAVGVMVNPTFSLEAIKNTVLSAALWVPIAMYAGFGLLYSGLEFMITVRRSVRRTTESWASYIQTKVSRYVKGVDRDGNDNRTSKMVSNEALIKAGQAQDASAEDREAAIEVCTYFGDRYKFDFIGFTTNKDKMSIEPKIDRLDLAQYIGAWVVFWPFYLTSLVLGDLLSEIWQTIANFVAEHCGRFVRNAFSNVFKLN